MKQIKKLPALAAGAVALVLVLGAGTAVAEPQVKVDKNGYVTKITKLKVIDDVGDTTKYTVKFKYDTAANLYKKNGFDFKSEENALIALIAAQEALNNTSPVPKKASSVGNKQFFIGLEVEQNTFVAGIGAEFISGVWDDCEENCKAGVGSGKANENYTWATFTEQ